MADKPALHCSFCGKGQYEVRQMIAGPAVSICDECVVLCIDIVNEANEADKHRKIVQQQHATLIEMMHDPVSKPAPKSTFEKLTDFVRNF